MDNTCHCYSYCLSAKFHLFDCVDFRCKYVIVYCAYERNVRQFKVSSVNVLLEATLSYRVLTGCFANSAYRLAALCLENAEADVSYKLQMMAGEEEDVQRRHGARTFQEALWKANITWGGAEHTAMYRPPNRPLLPSVPNRCVATDLRGGGSLNSNFFHISFLNLTVKQL